MPRVLLLAPQPFFQNRGTPIAVKLLLEELVALGCRVDLLTYHEGENFSLAGVRHYRILNIPGLKNVPPSISWKKIICNIFLFFKAHSLLRKNRYDIIHAVEESAFIAQALKGLYGIPYIYDMDSSLAQQLVEKLKWLKPFGPLFAVFEKVVIKGAMGVVAVCRALEDIVLGYAPDSLVVRLEDISLLDHNCGGEEDLRQRYNLSAPIMLYVGNLESYQGIDLLLESFMVARKQGAAGNLVIIGGTGESIVQYQKKAELLGIADATVFCGPRPVELLAHYLKQADILLSPRVTGNNTPMKLYSYLDSGKVVLATRLPTHTQVLSDDFACLVDAEPEHMAAGMVRLLGDTVLRDQLGEKAKTIVEERHSRKVFREKLTSFYAEIYEKLFAQEIEERTQS